MIFSDVALAQRLERAEGTACVRFAEARRRVLADAPSEWIEVGGAYAVFDGADSPITQTFGLGLFEELSAVTLDAMEEFFLSRGAPVQHEVSPLAGVAAAELLCSRGYKPIEMSSVLYLPLAEHVPKEESDVHARKIEPEETGLFASIAVEGWVQEHPEFREILLALGAVTAARSDNQCFLAFKEGVPGAAGTISFQGGVAVLDGSSTIPSMRRLGLQSALIEARLAYASQCGSDLAMMAAQPGSSSQRNVERRGFRIAYTRTKWRLAT
jgi:GNAT superfamily N-acetyltransferase